MRALSELYAALILFIASVTIAGMLYSYVEAHIPRPEPPRPVRVLELNETHVVCYAPVDVNITYWQTVGDFQCWLVPDINSSTFHPCPSIVPPGTYILVTPPWLCSP
ncbi:MAG TPA: hypothetical protein EYP33_01220 [Pyrodictium sp.]|nr:hypothetical protein [Pyrodictium sp.]